MSLTDWLNGLSAEEAASVFKRCCGSTAWAGAMANDRPYASVEAIHEAADANWANVSRDDVMEAFSHHPKIGSDIEQLRQKFAATASWSAGEQNAVTAASEKVLEGLRDGNIDYEKRFGYIFIVCATGKRADEMLEILEGRIGNDPATEFAIAKGEQAKITHLRIDKLEVP